MENLLRKEYYYNDKVLEKSKDYSENIVTESCYIALDYDNEINQVEEYRYELPDYQTIFIKNPRIQSPEILFKPSLDDITYKGKGIAFETNNSIIKCDEDIQNELNNGIVLTGINSQFKGIK